MSTRSQTNDIRRAMKKVVGMVGFILMSGLISFIPANAGDCSPEDPCMTYAEVDAS